MEQCIRCGGPVSSDEQAMTRKLINRGTQAFMCTSCLALHFETNEKEILERMQYFKDMGCTLFACNQ